MRKIKLLITTLAMSAIMASTALAGEWKQDQAGWWYQNDDGGYPISSWQDIDGKQYYFGSDGYMLVNTTTPDGKQVGADGALVVEPLFEFDTEDWHVKYTGYELSNDYKGNPCVIIYYDYTNKETEPQSAMAAWVGIEAYQNGIQCDGASISLSENPNPSVENKYKQVMPGITINVAESYRITDASPITIIVNDPFDWSKDAKSVTATLNIN